MSVFEQVFEASVALQNGDEVTALIDGHRLLAMELHDRLVLVMDGALTREGDAYEVAMAFVRTCRALDKGPKFAPARKTSHTRMSAVREPVAAPPQRDPQLATSGPTRRRS